MDRSWMYLAPRSSNPFISGVHFFLNFAFEKASVNGKILCPCSHCLNMYYSTREDILDHLICWGFWPEYSKWEYYGEGSTTTSSNTMQTEDEEVFNHDMHGLLNDLAGGIQVEPAESNVNHGQEAGNVRSKFDDIFKEAKEKVYPNAKYTKLSCVVHLYHLKCLNEWSNKSFSMLLEFLSELLPKENLLPKTTEQVKKMMSSLGLGYQKIHSCPNGCMLFWEDKEKEESCSICGSSRWKVPEDNSYNGISPTKKKPSKMLRWFPLKPRLQRVSKEG